MNVHAVVVNWNQPHLTLECVASLALNLPLDQVWLVDNGSDASVLPLAAERFPAAHGVQLAQNRGFAGGCNVGVQHALDAGAQAVLLLNNDALARPGTVVALTNALADDVGIGAVSPKVCFADRPGIIQSVGMNVDRASGMAQSIGMNQPDAGQHDQPADREALFGCAMLIRRAAWQTVGPFWEPFWSYSEEVDWCLRARAGGWRLRYTPNATVLHRASRSLQGDSPVRAYLIARNRQLLWQRQHAAGMATYAGMARALLADARTVGYYLRRGRNANARAVVRGWVDALAGRTGPLKM